MTQLPGLLGEIEALCGQRAALLIQREYGGRPMVVPADPRRTPEAALCRLIGVKAAEAIAEEIGTGRFNVPIGQFSNLRKAQAAQTRQIAALDAEGASLAKIAQSVGCHQRTVERHRQRERERDPDLFD